MDDELLSLKSFDIYKPVDVNHDHHHEVRQVHATNKRMVCFVFFISAMFRRLMRFCSLQDIGWSHPDEPGCPHQQQHRNLRGNSTSEARLLQNIIWLDFKVLAKGHTCLC